MNDAQISVYQPGIVAVVVFTLLVLFICYLDGPLYALYDITGGAVPPNLLIFPMLFLALAFWYVVGGHIRPEGFSRALLIASFFLIWWLVQTLFGISVYVLGYLQLATFVCLLPIVRAAFATDHGQDLAVLLGRALLIVHYLFVSYIVLTFALWHLTDTDISIGFLLNPTPLPEFFDYRPSGLSREPALAAITLATTYLGIYYLHPRKQTGALIAMIVAFAFIRTGTSIIFLAVFLTFMALEQREGKTRLGWTMFFGTAAVAVMSFVLWDRIGEVASLSDPSANMRLASIAIAFDVIWHDVLLGVGYGNFQEYAAYGADFDNFIDLFRAVLYKSDLAILNLWAEMGVFGFLIAFLFASSFYHARALLLMILPVLILVLAGGLLLPQLFALAAVAGVVDYRACEDA
ncbi:MAG: hypothetical protein COA65_06885 [Rhodospirillaceae bacterium]|nr:MAG: hypothetical protein COA65_06885 [Rhodospirillaceae bacterium]